MKIQLTIPILEQIVFAAKLQYQLNPSLSDTIEIILLEEADTQLGRDKIEVVVKSGYSECTGKKIQIINK